MNNTHPLVTIGIPTYNRADRYLPQALESAISQTYSNLEILIADNCSTDNTPMLVRSFKDSRIRYVKHKKNIGFVHNTAFCVEQARGDFLLMLHDDDLIDHDFVDVCLDAVGYTVTDVGLIRTGTRWIDPDGKLRKEIPNKANGLTLTDFFEAILMGKTGMYLCSTLFNVKRLREIGGFHSRLYHFDDVMAEIKLAAMYGRVDICEVKASNRIHPSKLTFAVTVSSWCEESLDLINLMCELVPESEGELRAEGMRAMAEFNYGLTGKIQSPLKRFWTYCLVFEKFGCRYLPPPIKPFVLNNPFFRGARYLKRRFVQKCSS